VSWKIPPGGDTPRRTAASLNRVIEGRTDNYGTFTLTPSATTTVVSSVYFSEDSTIALMPMTANAAAAVETTYIATVGNGAFTVTHANNAQTDRTFRYAWIG
jgi:hypothetical protein